MTYRELQGNPLTSGDDAEVLAASLDQADSIAKRLASLPEVSRTLTLSNFIPADQAPKIAAIKAAAPHIEAALNSPRQPGHRTATQLRRSARPRRTFQQQQGTQPGPGRNPPGWFPACWCVWPNRMRRRGRRAEAAFVPSLVYDIERLRSSLNPQPVILANLPADLVRGWILPDGRARVQVLPKGDPGDSRVLRKFATAIMAAEPSATGPAISLYQSGKTVIGAFIEAGALALVSIAILLLIALRRVGDVLLTLIPLIIAGTVTLEICVLTGTTINFANIIALPLLLGVGVAFKIYYIMAWRQGKTGLLQSSLTRAVIFSAMTNAVAFGSMWSSNYPGMSSMGKMMALALLCTMAAAVLFQPVLMGPPRQVKGDQPPVPDLVPEVAE